MNELSEGRKLYDAVHRMMNPGVAIATPPAEEEILFRSAMWSAGAPSPDLRNVLSASLEDADDPLIKALKRTGRSYREKRHRRILATLEPINLGVRI